MEIFKEFRFEAAHRLPNVAPEHRCYHMHGHSYRVVVHVEGPLDPRLGWVIDFADIQAAFEPLRAQLDHRVLNEVDGLANPTSEILARWIWERLSSLHGLSAVVVWETATSGCVFRGEPC